MQLNEYQERAMGTAVFKRDGVSGLTYTILALCGECGELANKLKKHLRANTEPNNEVLMDELSDCLWYVAATARELGYTLDEVGVFNIEKLAKRYTASKNG